MHTEVQLTLDDDLVAQAERLGSLDEVVTAALRRSFDPADMAARLRWAEDHALLIEAAGPAPSELKS
jgi:hypothetical protein